MALLTPSPTEKLALLTDEVVHLANQFLLKARPTASEFPSELELNLLAKMKELNLIYVLSLDVRFWSAVVGLHGWALRALTAAAEGDDWTVDVLRTTGRYLGRINPCNGCELTKRVCTAVTTALLDGDALEASARLFASLHISRHEEVMKRLDYDTPLMSCFACARTVRYNLGNGSSGGDASKRMFFRFVAALSESQLLEHAARLLFNAQSIDVFTAELAILDYLELVRLAASDLPVGWTVQGPRCLNAAGEAAITHPDMHAALAKLRGMLSRPCLQFLLGYMLTTRRHWLVTLFHDTLVGRGKHHGLPEELLHGGSMEDFMADRTLPEVLATAADVWRLTVSGPLPPRIAQPPTGLLTEEAAAVLAAAAAAQQPVPPRPSGMPYAAVNVFDLAHEALIDLMEYAYAFKPKLGTAGLGRLDREPLASSCLLLVRLCLELRSQHAAARLPDLWGSVSRALGLMEFGELDWKGRCELPLMLGLLLRLELAAPEQSGERTEDEEGLHAGVRGCPYSLGCAIKSLFLDRLEGLLRRAAAAVAAPLQPTKGLQRQASGLKVCLCLVNSVLRYSGMWPAALSHGSRRTVASLIVTLRRVTVATLDWEFAFPEECVPAAGHVSRNCMEGNLTADPVMVTYLGALLEQVIAVMQLPQPPPQQPPGSAAAAGAGAGARHGGHRRGRATNRGGSSSSSSSRAQAQLDPLHCNEEVEAHVDSAPMQVEWLVRAGGCPAAGSEAAAQQRSLTALALTQWLPLAVGIRMQAFVSVARAVRFAALQCLAAYVRSGAPPDAGAASSCGEQRRPADDGAGGSGAGGGSGGTDGCAGQGAGGVAATSQADAGSSAGTSADCCNAAAAADVAAAAAARRDAEAWRNFLMRKTNVAVWICCVLRGPGTGGHWPPPLRTEMESAALDALEVLLLAAPEPADLAGSVSELQQLMPAAADRHGRPALLAVLRQLWRQASKEMGAGGGGDGGSKLPGLMEALWREVRAHHDLARLPVLPSPVEVQRSAEAWGVVLCDNPECGNMDEVEKAKCKTCSRCVQVRYCCGACQLAHWRAEHSKECAEMAAAAGPASGGRYR